MGRGFFLMHFYSDALADVTFNTFPANVERVRDNNLRTVWDRTLTPDPGATVSFSWLDEDGDPMPVPIDAMLLLCEGTGEWAVSSGSQRVSGDGVSAFKRLYLEEPLGSDGTRPQFVMNATTLTVTVPTGGKLYEVYALKRDISINMREQRPMRYRRIGADPRTSAYFSESSELISYGGLSPGGKYAIQIGWDYLPENYYYYLDELERSGISPSDLVDETLDELKVRFDALSSDSRRNLTTIDDFEKLFLGPPLRNPFFIYPEPKNRPNEAYRVYWSNEFEPYPSVSTLDRQRRLLVGQGGSIRTGYTLDMHLLET